MNIFQRLKYSDPDAYERIGLMLEDYVCFATSQKVLSKRYGLKKNVVSHAIAEYFGDPSAPFYVNLSADHYVITLRTADLTPATGNVIFDKFPPR